MAIFNSSNNYSCFETSQCWFGLVLLLPLHARIRLSTSFLKVCEAVIPDTPRSSASSAAVMHPRSEARSRALFVVRKRRIGRKGHAPGFPMRDEPFLPGVQRKEDGGALGVRALAQDRPFVPCLLPFRI